MNDERKAVELAAEFLSDFGVAAANVALVLGSGLKSFAAQLTDARAVRLADVPELPVPMVEGHGGEVVVGKVLGIEVVCLTGRVHLYEGWSPNEVVRAVRAVRLCGVPRFVLTNAAGGIAPGFVAGDLMVIEDHLNLTGRSPLVGGEEPAFGPRFPDQSAVWDPELGERLHGLDPGLRRGVYAGLLGPSYETPAEVRMLGTLGASAVGMSTVHEAIALNAMGARIAGLSLVSNLAAGLARGPLHHGEVVAAGQAAQERMTRLLAGFCASFGA